MFYMLLSQSQSETAFSIKINNRRTRVKNANAIEVCQYLSNTMRTFTNRGNFDTIEELRNMKIALTKILTTRLTDSEGFESNNI